MTTCFKTGFILGPFKGEDECVTCVAAPGENDYSNTILSFTLELIALAI